MSNPNLVCILRFLERESNEKVTNFSYHLIADEKLRLAKIQL
jgi:hypothetical protein